MLSQITTFINNFRTARNVAAAQADIVAHSMGGLMTRKVAQLNNFSSAASFGVGPVHKLITIGTPHLGSPLALKLLQNASACMQQALADRHRVAILQATVGPSTWVGAAGDLQGCSDGSLQPCAEAPADVLGHPTPSQSIVSLQTSDGSTVETAYIAGEMGPNNLSGLTYMGMMPSAIPAFLQSRLGCKNDPLAQSLTPTLWPTIFNNLESDGIVAVISQMNDINNNGGSGTVAPGDIHSSGVEALGFNGPGELNDPYIANQILLLLNSPLDTTVSLGFATFAPVP